MHELDEQLDRQFRAVPMPSPLSLSDEQSDGSRCRADALSVHVSYGSKHHPDIAVLTVQGEIDLATSPVLREALRPVLEHQTGPVVMDLSEVPFMDSTAVHVLVDTLQRLELVDRRLAIACREGGQVHRLLGLVGLLDTMAVYRSLQSAVTGGYDVLRPEGEIPSASEQTA